MTLLDYQLPQTVYYEHSNFPCEYGGGRRQKHARTSGLNIQPGEKLCATTRRLESVKWVIFSLKQIRLSRIGSAIDFQLIRSALRLSVWRLRASLQNAVTTESPAEILTEILS
jgi:hypothetical protein